MAESRTHGSYCMECLSTFTGAATRCPNNDCAAEQPEIGWGKLLGPGDEIDNRLAVHRKLTLGQRGVTYLCEEKQPKEGEETKLLAVQVMSRNADWQTYMNQFEHECRTLQGIDHPGIIRVIEVVNKSDTDPYVVVEYPTGGTLLDHLRQQGALQLVQVAQLGLQICDALHTAHERGIIHGDLRPENILLTSATGTSGLPNIRIADFGCAEVLGTHSRGGFNLNPQYTPPELFRGIKASVEGDTYSLGAVLFFCQALHPLLNTAGIHEPIVLATKLEEELPPRWIPPYSESSDTENPTRIAFFNALLASTMDPEIKDRLGLDQVRDYLESILDIDDEEEEEVFSTPEWTEEEPAAAMSTEEEANILSAFRPFVSQEMEEEEYEEDEEEEEEEGEEAPSETEEDPEIVAAKAKKEAWIKALRIAAMILAVIGGTGMIAGAAIGTWVWFKEPQMLNPEVLESRGPAPTALLPGDPSTQPDYEALMQSIDDKAANLSDCNLGSRDRLRLDLIVEPDGSVRSVRSTWLPRKMKWCVRRKLLGMKFTRTGAKPARVITSVVVSPKG